MQASMMGMHLFAKGLALLMAYLWVGGTALRTLENLALHKKAYQSSTHGPGLAGRAVDGGLSQNYQDGSCTHTQGQTKAYWEVDLGKAACIHHVKIYNRRDCCVSWLTDVELYIGLSKESYTRYGIHEGIVESTHTFWLQTAVIGQWVRLKIEQETYMIFCEVQVFAYDCFAEQYRINENQAGLEASIKASKETATIIHCAHVCFKTYICEAASYNEETQRCELLTANSTEAAVGRSALIPTD